MTPTPIQQLDLSLKEVSLEDRTVRIPPAPWHDKPPSAQMESCHSVYLGVSIICLPFMLSVSYKGLEAKSKQNETMLQTRGTKRIYRDGLYPPG